MKRWKRFPDKIFALVTSPGFEDLPPAEQDRLVYSVDVTRKLVYIERARTHYGA